MSSEFGRLTEALADRYTIERELGRGGMATVYLARDLKHERRVAIKVLQPELAAVLGPERFLREIKLTAQLNHPHILPLLDSGQAEGLLYYVMPYVEGESLRDRLKREKQLPVEHAIQIAREVADALDYAHRHDLIHRDIKPENILLEEQHAVVADFGIARAISAAGGEKLTATGVAVGTPEYMSPEQASGRGELDRRSDIYALGCVLYEMLAGQPPFTGPTVESVVHQHLAAEPPDVTAMRRAVPAEVVGLLRRALEKAPADRPATGAAFAQALQVGAGPPPRSLRVGPRRMVVGLAVGGAALLAALILWRGPWAGGRDAAADAPPRLVVLPFENLGAAEDEYFADGMTEEITSRLAQVPGLAVIGRTSAMQYKGAGKSLRTIGEELEVQYVLEGTVRWSVEGSERRLRITPQLIRVPDEAHVWAERYDAVFADVFAVQGRIAAQVVTALGATLAPAAASVAESPPPTRNAAAYEQYLRGNALYARCFITPCPSGREAARYYEEAVRLDPGFAAAWARLSLALRLADPNLVSPLAADAADRALALAPDLPDVHLAVGRLSYLGPGQDLARTEAAFRRALELGPNHPEALYQMGLLLRRRGDMLGAAELLARLADRDPRDERAQYDAGGTYARLRRPDEAERYLERHLVLRPESRPGRLNLALVHVMRGDSMAARRVVTGGALFDFYGPIGLTEFGRLLCDDACTDAARAWLVRSGPPPNDSLTDWDPVMARGRVAQMAGDTALARSYLGEAVRRLEGRIAAGGAGPRHQELAAVSAWLGRKEVALRAARDAVRLYPVSEDATNGPGRLNTLAEVYATFGEDELALEQLETLLSVPSFVSAPLTRVNPVWRRFHGNPRFEALLAKYPNPSR